MYSACYNFFKEIYKDIVFLFEDCKITDKKIMEYGIYLLVIVLFIGATVSLKFLGLYIPAIFIIFRVCLRNKIPRFWKSPIFIFLMLFVLSGILSTIFAEDAWRSLYYLEKFHIRPLLIYLIVVTVFSKRELFQKILNLLSWTSLIYIIWSFSFYAKDFIATGTIGRVDLTNVAWPLTFLAPFLIWKIITTKNSRNKKIWWLILILSIISLILSGQRSALLGLFVALLIWAFYLNWKTKLTLFIIIVVCATLLFTFAGNFVVIQDYLYRGIESQQRDNLRNIYTEIVRDNYLFGIGLDNETMRLKFSQVKKPRELNTFATPHFMFLTISVRQGLVGLISYILLLLVSIICIIKESYCQKLTSLKAGGISLLACLVGMYIFYSMFSEIVLLPFALVISLIGVYLTINKTVKLPNC